MQHVTDPLAGVRPTDIWTVWEKTLREAPHAPAAVDPTANGTVWTRQDLHAAAIRIADNAPMGVSGKVVAFARHNHPAWLAMFLALQRLGAICLPLDSSLPAAQHGRTASALGASWLMQGDGTDWSALAPEAVPGLDDAPSGGFCLVKATSGTTGQPRAFLFTSANMLADGGQIISTMDIRPDDRNLGAIPLGHSYGLGNLVMPLILQGTAVICSTDILPHALAAQIERYGATFLPGVPVVLRALGESFAAASRLPLKTMKRVISAGAPLRPEAAGRFLECTGLAVQNFYGSSETGGICFDRTGDATLTGRGVGLPLDGVKVRLGDEGRVVVNSAAVIAPGEWTVADLGAWNEYGELVLTGRASPLVNIGGKKVAPAEIERTLRGLDGVTDAWIGVQTREIGASHHEEFLIAAVESSRSREEILSALVDTLPAWQVPRRLWVMAQLPRNARGKPDRAELERLTRL